MKQAGSSLRELQNCILEIMKYIDRLCRESGIAYFIMGGTALGAVRHGGFIPWDDDLDIFMTPAEYGRFRGAMQTDGSESYVLQEWRTTPDYLEYAKVRKNGTAFIEAQFAGRTDLHQGIYVDIMLLHKVPDNRFLQRLVYVQSKYVTLYALSQRGWKPKTGMQAAALRLLKLLPNRLLAKHCYRRIYRYDSKAEHFHYSYWITKASFRQGLFEPSMFERPAETAFENCRLLCPQSIEQYLTLRYGDYHRLPSEAQRRADIHALVADVQRDYRTYIGNESANLRTPQVPVPCGGKD